MIAVIIVANDGGRGLLRTSESVGRLRTVRELRLALPADRKIPLADSIVRRLGATAIRHGGDAHDALNEAVRLTTTDILAIVPAGTTLAPNAAGIVLAAFERSPGAAALASPLRLHTPDGIGAIEWNSRTVDAAALLTDPRSVSPVLLIRRAAWDEMGGVDTGCGALALYDLWLRLALRGHRIGTLDEPVVWRELSATASGPEDSSSYLAGLTRIFNAHGAAIRQVMNDVLVAREVRFGNLRESHRRLIAERDEGLAELDRLRAETAHHRAYLKHHGRDAFEWGDLRRTDPVSRDWGYDRGGPVDRRFIEAFVEAHSSDVSGDVLEVQEDDFTRLAGGPRVSSSSILDVDPANQRATVIADLRCAPEFRDDQFDCVVLTQTIHVIDDMAAVAREVHRILKPGGVLLATIPSASRVCLEYGESGDLWRATPAGAAALFEPIFGSNVEVEGFGNVLTNVAFLHGLGAQELTDDEYGARDPYFPALTAVRARKRGSGRSTRGVVLLYHRVRDGQDAHGLNVSPGCLGAHLAWLTRECTVVPLERILGSPVDDLPERAVALTFDDGYEDNFTIAAPLLQGYGAAATYFATTRWLDETGEYWWDALERILLGASQVPSLLELRIGSETVRLATATPAEREASHWRLHPLLVHATATDRDRAIARLQQWSATPPPAHQPMRADAIRDLARMPGVTIGGHSVTHVALPDQPDEVVRREIVESRDRLAKVVGGAVTAFAYPYGAVDARVARIARREVRWALTCEARAVPASFDAARVPRLDVKAWTVDEFARRVNSLFAPARTARTAVTRGR